MSRSRNYHSQVGSSLGSCRSSFNQNISTFPTDYNFKNYNISDDSYTKNYNISDDSYTKNYNDDHSRHLKDYGAVNYINHDTAPSMKRRKSSVSTWEDCGIYSQPEVYNNGPFTSDSNSNTVPQRPYDNSTTNKRDRSKFEDDDVVFMSRHEIERCSPSRKDGIDAMHEAHLRFSYCAFLQNLGLRLDLPQTTVGTSMVLCHRFFLRRSHACHDRFLTATAALFLAAKSEETGRPLNDVVRASSEIYHKQDISILSYMLPVDWFEKYRERVIQAEQLLLTTLDFELNVQHPYAPLTSTLEKLGLLQSTLVNLALNLISEGLRSSLWLQFKPHQIAAGAAYLAARYLNVDLSSYRNIWVEFQTPPFVVEDIAQQLQELF